MSSTETEMTPDQKDARDRIVAFASQVGRAETPPEEKARRRGWLDAEGAPTDQGLELLESLGDQRSTRTVFRGL
jgi:hypothetical protein